MTDRGPVESILPTRLAENEFATPNRTGECEDESADVTVSSWHVLYEHGTSLPGRKI